MENNIAIHEKQNSIHLRSNTPSQHEMIVFHTMAEQAIDSKMYKGIGDKAGVMMIMLAARELGIAPMQALNGGLNITQGKVEISARMMSALIRRAGHTIKVEECSASQCVLVGIRCDTGEKQESSFSVAEAQQAGLVKQGGGWVKWPKDMCFARALSRLARQLFSDVIGMGYVEGEIQSCEIHPNIEVISSKVVEDVVDENKWIQEYLDIFSEEDRHLAMEYLNAVKKQFEYTTIETIKILTQDVKVLFERFNKWVNRFKK